MKGLGEDEKTRRKVNKVEQRAQKRVRLKKAYLGVSGDGDCVEGTLGLFGERAVIDETTRPFASCLCRRRDLFNGGHELGLITSSGDVAKERLRQVVGPDEHQVWGKRK